MKKKTSSKTSSKSQNLQVDLQRRINEAQRNIDELKQELRRRRATEPSGLPPRFPLWVAVRDYLRDNDGEDTLQNIIDGLLDAGHDLGKYPLRNVKTLVVSNKMRTIFTHTKRPNGTEMVKLVEGTAAYTPLRYRRQK